MERITGHYPRHSKRYRDFASEHARLQKERVAAFREYKDDIDSGRYPEPSHVVGIDDDELAAFLKGLKD